MTVQLTNGTFYAKTVIWDGTSSNVTLDFFNEIAADISIAKKNPIGVVFVQTSGAGTPSGVISGTEVTITISPTPPAGQMGIDVQLEFSV